MTAVPVLLLAAASPAPAAGLTTPVPGVDNPVTFIDTFNNNKLSGWAKQDLGTISGPSHWYASGGTVKQNRGIYGGATTRATVGKAGTFFLAGDPAWGNIDFTVTASSPDDDAFGVVFGYQDKNNYYRFSMDRQRHYRRLVKVVDGAFTKLAETDGGGYTRGAKYRLRVLAKDGSVSIYINDNRFTGRSIPTGPVKGQVGLYTWAESSTTFDGVTVHAQSDDYFTIAVVPDTQYEASGNPPQLAAQTKWLAANRGPERIATVLQEGDVVDDMRASGQWATARSYYDYLDGKVPFTVAAGNHDEEIINAPRPHTKDPRAFNKFVDSFVDYRIENSYTRGDYRNTFQLLSAGGLDLLVINIDFGASDPVLAWAGRVVDKYPHRHVIMLTHDFLGTDGNLRGAAELAAQTGTGDPGDPDPDPTDPDPTDPEPEDPTLPHTHNPAWNDGVQMWDKFVRHHANVQFVLNGHVIQKVSPDQPWAVARRVTPNDAGKNVYQVLTNFQTWNGGGNGYLRLFRFYPRQGKVEVRTFSPWQAEDATLKTPPYLTDDGNQFTFEGVDLGAW